MDTVRQWALAICSAVVLGAALDMLTPSGRYERLVRLAASALTVSVLLAPLTELSEIRLDAWKRRSEFSAEAEGLADTIERQSASAASEALKKAVAAELDMMKVEKYEISVQMDISEQGGISIGRVTVTAAADGATRTRISQRLKNDLGIAAEVIGAGEGG